MMKKEIEIGDRVAIFSFEGENKVLKGRTGHVVRISDALYPVVVKIENRGLGGFDHDELIVLTDKI